MNSRPMDPEPEDPIAVLDDLAAEAGDVDILAAGDSFEYSRTGVVFAAREQAAVIELHLGPDIAEAARRTPDTTASGRGSTWVRFAPTEWDDHALDRLEAWFRVAWRMAAGGGR